MAKIIINYSDDDDISDLEATRVVNAVVNEGIVGNGVNGKQYAYQTRVDLPTKQITVYSKRSKAGSYIFNLEITKPMENN
jgi:hypothetical protein